MVNYTRNTWETRLGTGLNRFRDNLTSTEFEFENIPTTITQAGTPFNVAWMNNLEEGTLNNANSIGRFASIFEFSGSTFTNTEISNNNLQLFGTNLTGTAEKTITPTYIEEWNNLKVNASAIDANNSASVDILSTEQTPTTLVTQTLTNGENTIDLSSIDVSLYSEINTRFNLSRNSTGDNTPQLIEPSWTWKGYYNNREIVLQDTTLTSVVSEFNFNIDPTIYNNAIIEIFNLTTPNSGLTSTFMDFNSDSGGNYNYILQGSNSTSVSVFEGSTALFITTRTPRNNSNGLRGTININLNTGIMDSLVHSDDTSINSVSSVRGSYSANSPVSSFRIYNGANFQIGTRFKVTGVRLID